MKSICQSHCNINVNQIKVEIETMLYTPEKTETRFYNKRQKSILALQPNDEFLFSYTGPRTWRLKRYRVLDNSVVELISVHTHRESTPYPEGPQLVDSDSRHRFTNLEQIAKDAVGSFMVFKEL